MSASETSLQQPQQTALKTAVHDALDSYFNYLDGEPTDNVHAMVMNEVEATMIRHIYHRTDGNQVKCSTLLGISRNNLRAKLEKYNII